MKQSYHFLMILFISCFTTKLYSQSVPSYVPTNGLVGWWGFNGNSQDGSGNGNHGTVNGATLTTDRFGNVGAFLFSNNTNNITIPNLYQNNILSYSTTGWFKINQSQFGNGGGVILAGNLPLSTPAGLRFTLGGPHGCTWQVEDGWNTNGVLGIDSNITYNDNEWHFFAAVFNTNPGLIEASAFKIYIDNQLISTRTFQQHWPPGSGFQMGFNVNAPIINNSLPVIIGNSNSFTAGFNGVLDDISIYHRALTPQEITNLYTSQLPTQTSLCLPSITTNTPTSIGIDSVIVGGNITNDGGSSIVLRGVCYSNTPNPNMGNMRTENGSGVGFFSTILRNLSPSTTYYVRSYAKNTNGVVVYGDEVTFTTLPLLGQPCPGTPTVTDIDGNVYNTVKIGNQCWTQSNLKVSRFRNGDSILTGFSNNDWYNLFYTPAYSIYNNDAQNNLIFGKLYNHVSVRDSREICPTGWHVPTDTEWNVLVKFLDSDADTSCNNCVQSPIAGGALKSTSIFPIQSGWMSPNTGATNSSGFFGTPGGMRDGHTGTFNDLGNVAFWWTSSTSHAGHPARVVLHNGANVNKGGNFHGLYGFSVRCLKD
jgi:uncharacterized protein (TIGR02145 family)